MIISLSLSAYSFRLSLIRNLPLLQSSIIGNVIFTGKDVVYDCILVICVVLESYKLSVSINSLLRLSIRPESGIIIIV